MLFRSVFVKMLVLDRPELIARLVGLSYADGLDHNYLAFCPDDLKDYSDWALMGLYTAFRASNVDLFSIPLKGGLWMITR